jgi:hypothetical protein
MKKYIMKYFGLCICLVLCACGSYYYAEYYTFKTSKKELINRIEEFKEKNPQYKIIVDGIETKDNVDEYNFYHSGFYIETENVVLYTVINVYDIDSDATIGLVTVLYNVGMNDTKFYRLEKLSKKERKKYIKIFETEILDKLGKWQRE